MTTTMPTCTPAESAELRCRLVDQLRRSGAIQDDRFLPMMASFMVARPTATASAPSVRGQAGVIAAAAGWVVEEPLDVDLADRNAQFLGALVQPDIGEIRFVPEHGGPATTALVDAGSGSWARVTPLIEPTDRD